MGRIANTTTPVCTAYAWQTLALTNFGEQGCDGAEQDQATDTEGFAGVHYAVRHRLPQSLEEKCEVHDLWNCNHEDGHEQHMSK